MKQNINDNTKDIRFTLARKATLLFFILVTFSTIVRPFFADLPLILTIIGIFNSLLTGSLFLLFTFAKPRTVYLYLLTVCVFLAVTPLLVLSGGINSQFAVLIPLFPLLACLVITRNAGIITAIVNIALILLLRYFETNIQQIDEFSHNIEIQNARTFWLCLGTLLSLFFALQFTQLNQQLSSKLEYQANIDVLTGLFNRRYIIDKLMSDLPELAKQERWLSVLMIDVDHFKNLNDQYGHLFGDECLKAVARSLDSSVRNEFDFAGRYGGEEFLIILKGVNQEKAGDIAEKIRQNIENIEFINNNEKISLTVTIGYCSRLAHHVANINHIINLADQALYEGKANSRNCVVSANIEPL